MKFILLTTTIATVLLAACKPETHETTAAPSATEIAEATPYPLETCLVSGEKLGSMGEPPVIAYQGQQIKFCCKSCIPDFEKEPEKFLAKLKEGKATQD